MPFLEVLLQSNHKEPQIHFNQIDELSSSKVSVTFRTNYIFSDKPNFCCQVLPAVKTFHLSTGVTFIDIVVAVSIT